MTDEIPLQSMVALTEGLPEFGLRRGEVGTVVGASASGVCEVEFRGDDGRAYAMVAVEADHLLRLHFAPATAAGE